MPGTKFHKVALTVSTTGANAAGEPVRFIPDFALNVTAATVSTRLNQIPTATIRVVPRSRAQINQLNEFDDQLFSAINLEVLDKFDKGDEPDFFNLFSGIIAGISTSVGPNNGSADINLYGGLYRLSQINASTLGMSVPSENSGVRIALTSQNNLQSIFSNTIDNEDETDLIPFIRNVLSSVYSQIIRVADETTLNTVNGEIGAAIKNLYRFNADEIQNIFLEEIAKLKSTPGDLNMKNYAEFVGPQVKDIVFTLSQNPNVSLWELLVILAEKYQIAYGYYRDTAYAVPNFPLQETNVVIQKSDIVSLDVAAFPIRIPTRCYVTAKSDVNGLTNNRPLFGAYPPIDPNSTAKLTELEKKIGNIRPFIYEIPGGTIYVNSIPNDANKTPQLEQIQNELDRFAQGYLAKEVLKFRTATLRLRFFPKIAVGLTVQFEDPLYGRIYTGYVVGVTHSISSGSVSTTLQLTHVISETEKKSTGLIADGLFTNLLYPSYSSTKLATLLKL